MKYLYDPASKLSIEDQAKLLSERLIEVGQLTQQIHDAVVTKINEHGRVVFMEELIAYMPSKVSCITSDGIHDWKSDNGTTPIPDVFPDGMYDKECITYTYYGDNNFAVQLAMTDIFTTDELFDMVRGICLSSSDGMSYFWGDIPHYVDICTQKDIFPGGIGGEINDDVDYYYSLAMLIGHMVEKLCYCGKKRRMKFLARCLHGISTGDTEPITRAMIATLHNVEFVVKTSKKGRTMIDYGDEVSWFENYSDMLKHYVGYGHAELQLAQLTTSYNIARAANRLKLDLVYLGKPMYACDSWYGHIADGLRLVKDGPFSRIVGDLLNRCITEYPDDDHYSYSWCYALGDYVEKMPSIPRSGEKQLALKASDEPQTGKGSAKTTSVSKKRAPRKALGKGLGEIMEESNRADEPKLTDQ